jgi:hypothetical protein
MQLIVMDHTGDTRQDFDVATSKGVKAAEDRFRALTGSGFTAARRAGPGEVALMRKFDKDAEEVLFYPRLAGG